MQAVHLGRGPRPRPASRPISLVLTVLVALAGLTFVPTAAHAAGTDVVTIPDANLKAAINTRLGGGRALDADVTVADAALVTTIVATNIKGPIADLTGMEALTNLTSFAFPATLQGSTYSDLTPLSGLTKLTALTLLNGHVSDLSPLEGMTALKTLALNSQQISDLTPLSGLTGLTSLALGSNEVSDLTPLSGLTALAGLSLADNEVSDLDGIPTASAMATLVLNDNEISDLSPLSGKFTKTVLTTVNLANNKITDPSAVAAYGNGGGKIGLNPTTTQGLFLAGNKIGDFSSLAGWTKPPVTTRIAGQHLHVGPYGDGVHVTLKPADTSTVGVLPVEAGFYNESNGLLTLTDPAAETISLYPSNFAVLASPTWTVHFDADPDNPPQVADPGSRTAVVGDPITPFTMTATGGTTPYAWSATDLPAGLSIDPISGEVSGTPTAAGTSTVTGTATDANLRQGSQTFTITVTPAPTAPVVAGPGNKTAVVGDPITSFTMSATGGVAPITWSQTGLPNGLSLDPTSGEVSGTPTAQGTATVTVTATDAGSRHGSATFTITVSNAPAGVNIPDANLKAMVNARLAQRLGTTRTPTQTVTPADALRMTDLQVGTFGVALPISDLTGLEAMPNLEIITTTERGNTVSDLSPLSGLTKLRMFVLPHAKVSNVAPLSGVTSLTGVGLPDNEITDPSPLASLTKLTALDLDDNQIRDAGMVPSLPKLTILRLASNEIRDPAPLADNFDPDELTTLDLAGNKIADASALAPLGRNGAALGSQLSSSDGLILTNNRIADFSAFSDWPQHNASRTDGQTIYAGRYRSGGVTVTLRTDVAATPAVTPAGAGSYNPATGLLTITDTGAESVTVSPNWTVRFTTPPLEPGDAAVQVTGTPQVGQKLSYVSGSAFPDGSCPGAISAQWLRDGDGFSGVPHFQSSGNDQVMGMPGTGGSYWVSVTDLGHQLQLRITCTATGATQTSTPMPITTAVAEQPLAQGLEGPSRYRVDLDGQVSTSTPTFSGVVGDPTNPTIPVHLAQTDADGQLVDASQIQLTLDDVQLLSSTNPEAVTSDDVRITGTGADRTIAIDPQLTASVVLSFTVTGTTGRTSTLNVAYMASVATTPTSRVLLGSSDASTAIAVGDGRLLVADDEKSTIRLYDGTVSRREEAEFGIGADLNQEVDFEASARKGDRIWWFGSHGNSKDGSEIERYRHSIFETRLTGTGADAKLSPVGQRYGNLRDDLLQWDDDHGARFGLRASAAKNQAPDPVDGFNLEGAEFSPDGSELYLGFRSPLEGRAAGGRALIVPLTNLEDLTSGLAARARFGEPILLDLDGDSIREIRKNDRGEYLILSAIGGGSKQASAQTLWAWNGDPATAPRKLTTQLPLDVEPNFADNQGAWEGIGQMPERLAPGAQVRLIMDQGYDKLYGGALQNKKDTNDYTNKARTDVVTLTGAAGTLASLSNPGAFPAQATATTGVARQVVVTNSGSNLLHLGKVRTADQDGVSADDFLISGDTCADEVLAPDETCTIRVRFSPQRENASSAATLVVRSDVPGGSTTVALAGTSTGLPQGPAGQDGADGADGQDGADGPAGENGTDGQDGSQGPAGPKGDKGDPGAPGITGPRGPAGTVGFSAAGGTAKVQAHRGAKAKVRFRLDNRTASAIAAQIRVRAGKGVTAPSVKRIKALGQGRSTMVSLVLKIGRNAKVGKHQVTVIIRVGDTQVARTVVVRVTR